MLNDIIQGIAKAVRTYPTEERRHHVRRTCRYAVYCLEKKKAKEAEHRKVLGRLTREIEALEAQIARLEAEQAELEATLADPATHADSERSRKASLRYEKVKAALEAAMESWTEKEAEREGLGPA